MTGTIYSSFALCGVDSGTEGHTRAISISDSEGGSYENKKHFPAPPPAVLLPAHSGYTRRYGRRKHPAEGLSNSKEDTHDHITETF